MLTYIFKADSQIISNYILLQQQHQQQQEPKQQANTLIKFVVLQIFSS